MTKITQLSQLDPGKYYSYVDYMSWQFDEAVELIKGKIMAMSPAPNVKHQRISTHLTAMLHVFFKHQKCQVFAAPFDVRLYDRKKSILADRDIHTVVQPDLCIICNPELLDEQGCNGAPDWIIEIVSKGSSKRDMQIKYALYQESKVTEYWIVYPGEQAIHQFVLDENERYQLKNMYAVGDIATPSMFPELAVDLAEIFE